MASTLNRKLDPRHHNRQATGSNRVKTTFSGPQWEAFKPANREQRWQYSADQSTARVRWSNRGLRNCVRASAGIALVLEAWVAGLRIDRGTNGCSAVSSKWNARIAQRRPSVLTSRAKCYRRALDERLYPSALNMAKAFGVAQPEMCGRASK